MGMYWYVGESAKVTFQTALHVAEPGNLETDGSKGRQVRGRLGTRKPICVCINASIA